jgi:hypothetical protein
VSEYIYIYIPVGVFEYIYKYIPVGSFIASFSSITVAKNFLNLFFPNTVTKINLVITVVKKM